MTDTLNDFSIISLNVGRGMCKAELLTYIRDRMGSTSVFCFQENDSEIRQVFDKMLLGDFAGYHTTEPAEPNDYNVSTYVRRNIKVLDESTIYGEVEEFGLALRCELADDQGRRVAVTNVHGVAFPGHKLDTPARLKLSRRLLDLARDSKETQIIAGDFNLLPETKSVQLFAANGFRNLIDEFDIPTTRNELAWKNYPPESKQLFADYTFIRGDSIACRFSVDSVTVSDHLPMILEIYTKTETPFESATTTNSAKLKV